MNLELLDPWEQEYPQLIEETLEDGYVLNCKFNKRGTLLAAGCLDGRCVVWDFDTKGISRNLVGHVKPIASISWSHNGRCLLSASKDWTCIYWDLVLGIKQTKIRFDTPLMMAQMHPKNNRRFAAALFQEHPVIVDILDDNTTQKIVLPTELIAGDEEASASSNSKPASSYVTAVSWNKTGQLLYTGTSKGYLNIIDVESLKIIYSVRIANTTMKGIQWSRNGRDMLINANDRVIRYFQINQDGIPKLKNKFQDLVNRIQWSQSCFSADGEFVIGGSGHKAEHNIYIWDKKMGNLVKILEGPKEPLDDLCWHPVRPIIGSVSSFGNIYIWTAKHEENWSAFAPDFTELDENLEYEEKEDEFDVVQQDETTQRKLLVQDVELVDVTTNMPIHAYVDSDDEDESEVYYLPTLEIQHQNSDNEKDKVVTKKQKLAPKKKKMLDDQKKPQRKKDRFIEQF